MNEAEAAIQRGDFQTAEKLCLNTLQRDPKDYPSLVMLAVVLRERGEFEDSAACAEQAIRLRPGIVEAYYQLAQSMIAMARFERAATVLQQATKLRPEIGVFHFSLGLVYENLGRRAQAEESYKFAVRLNPHDLQARLALISHSILEEKLEFARAELEPILQKVPDSASANLLMAELCVAEEGLAKAEPFIRKSLSLEPRNSIVIALLGQRESELGNFAEAERLFKQSLEINPYQGQAYLGMSMAKKLTREDEPLIAQMEELKKRASLVPTEAASLRFALAKAYDNLGEFRRAMELYDEGHPFAYLARFGPGSFDEDKYRTIFDTIISTYPDPILQTQRLPERDEQLPILIVGMIRSGTTLTEQILSSHPEVAAAGEHLFWQRVAGRAELLPGIKSDPNKVAALGRAYIQELRKISPAAARITDKYPGNYLRLGLLSTALPHAKIIHCRRSPIDNALSIYVTPNKASPVFSHSKEAIVFAYRQYERLMDHWRSVLPKQNFFEVQYEELVENPEPVIRQMIEFCGLRWSDQCLSPELNPKDVATPSLWQVRQPIYKSSVERWRRYEPWLGALKQLIEP
jgi:tetratricopeptide (TPR) repeat protein